MAASRRFHVWSEEGSTLFLARRLQAQGADVALYIHDAEAREVGRGLVPRTTDPNPPKDAIVLFDAIGHGAQGRFYRLRGQPVIGGNPFDLPLEKDRAAGARIMAEHGIALPETKAFTDIAAAQQWLEAHEGAWFLKVSGEQWESMTTNAPTSAAMIRFLAWAKRQPQGYETFELQRKVTGAEVSVEGWFDGQRFVPPFNCTIEEKKFLAGGLGPRTGCESCVVWILEGDAPPLPALTLLQMEDTLRRERYVGPLDLNCIVDAEGVPHGLEWTARFGFDALQAYTALIGPTLGEQLEAFAHGRLDRWEFAHEDAVSLVLRISVPPYPTPNPKLAASFRGLPLDPVLLHDTRITVEDVMRGPDGQPAMAGRDGCLGTLGAIGTDLDALRAEVLSLAKRLDIPSLQYRIDPIDRAERDLAALATHGFLSHAGLAGLVARGEAADDRPDADGGLAVVMAGAPAEETADA